MGTTQKGSTAWLRHQIPRDRIWRIIDARDQVLGRLSTQIATILQGKHKAIYEDNIDSGDPVIVINARHVALTGRKSYKKEYIHHTGYPGGLRRVPIRRVMESRPKDVIRLAVRSMLPKNKLRKIWMSNLRIFLDAEHDHHAQNPVPVPPVHSGSRIGNGGPPTEAEMDHWWIQCLTDVPDDVLDDVVREVRAEIASETDGAKLGIAQLLHFEHGDDGSAVEADACQRYIRAAEQSLQQDPVIVPSRPL